MAKTIHSPEYREVVALLRELRQKAGLHQQELAERLDRPQSFVSKYEAGERRVDIVELRTICHALGTDLVAFVRELEKRLNGPR